jgi:hypothetical protein
MSWDLHIKENACPTCGRGDEVYDRNYTSNMGQMLRQANFDWDEINGKTTEEALPHLERLIKALESEPDAYRALNPPNGWGDYDSFLAMLIEFVGKCREYSGVVRISR